MKKLDFSKQDIQKYKEEFYSFSAVRKLEIEELLEKNKREQAIKVLKDSKELDKEHPGLVADYSYRKQAMVVSDRKHYKNLMKYLKKIAKYPEGKIEAEKIAEEWKTQYYRRSAMMEELRRSGF